MRRSLAVSGAAVLAVLGAVVLSIQPVSGGISGSPPAPPESVIVTGTVQTLPPDGGLRVTLGSDTVPVTGTVGANVIGTVPVSGSVNANVVGTVPVSGSVQSFPPDGGMRMTLGDESVKVVGPVDTNANITNTYVPVGMDPGAPKLSAEVTGLAGTAVTTTVSGSVLISGYSSVPTVALQNGTVVALDSASLQSITNATAERVCTYGTPLVVAALTTTASAQPTTAQVGRTEITFTNLQADSRELWCRVGATPTSTNALVMKGGVSVKLNVTDAQVVNCACSSSTCRINLQEASCSHP
jgi:hypothetical protein